MKRTMPAGRAGRRGGRYAWVTAGLATLCLFWGSLLRAAEQTPDKTVQDFLAAQTNLVNLLASIKDAPSGKQAADKVKMAMFRLDRAADKFKSVRRATPDEEKLIRSEHGPRLLATEQRLNSEIARLKELAGTQTSLQNVFHDLFRYKLPRTPYTPAPETVTTPKPAPTTARPTLPSAGLNASKSPVPKPRSRQVRVRVVGVRNSEIASAVLARLKSLGNSAAGGASIQNARTQGEVMTVALGPTDASASQLAEKVDFGTATVGADQTLTIQADPDKLKPSEKPEDPDAPTDPAAPKDQSQ